MPLVSDYPSTNIISLNLKPMYPIVERDYNLMHAIVSMVDIKWLQWINRRLILTQRTSYCGDEEEKLVARIIELVTQYGRYGYRRITALLNREG